MLWRSLKPNRWLKSLKGRLQTNYVALVLCVGVALFGLVFWFYLWGIIRSSSQMVARLQDLVASGAVADLHALSYTIAVLLGVLVAASTVPFALSRVWINDRTINAIKRTTEAAEQGLITDRITATVTGLGAEKTVKTKPVKTAVEDAPATE